MPPDMPSAMTRRMIVGGIVLLVLIAVGVVVFQYFVSNQATPAATVTEESPITNESMPKLNLSSSAFQNNTSIPAHYTCDAESISPPLSISEVPAGTKSFALVMHDPDAPTPGGFTHWVRFNIPPETTLIQEGVEPSGIAGAGSSGKRSYVGPCPPSGNHRYILTLYALDEMLSLQAGATKTELEKAMAGHIITQTELMGRYTKIQNIK